MSHVSDPGPPPLPTPAPGEKRRAIAAEQAHLDLVHDRVEALRRRANERVASASAAPTGPTFQARFERDVAAHHHASRASRFTFGDVESLTFGRLDLADGEVLHVGRVSVVDDDGEVVLVDWRAPAAAAFYQATAAVPLDVARRRTLVTRGREVRDLDDEVLDAEAAAKLGLTSVTGQGALLASLSRERSGTMRDIVATIQAEQDRIIRAPATGTLVVTGGPGTGKTVVALHRVASLLYRDRDRFEGRGVLVIGPSAAFTEYTARVLPALGEDRAVQKPLAGLAPRGARIRGWDTPDVGRIKGDRAMIELARRLVAAALPPIPPETRVSFDGTTVTVAAAQLEEVRERQLANVRVSEQATGYHDRAEAADQALRAALWRIWRPAHRAAGARVPEAREGSGFDAALDDSPQVTMLRRCYWPTLDPIAVVAAAASGEVDLARLGAGLLSEEDLGTLRTAWAEADGWTVDDVALLDEVATLLGPPPGRRPTAAEPDEDDPGLRLGSEELHLEVAPPDVDADSYRDFAHVVVDEAQDLTPMQWRAVARRGPYASWTVVGDLAQRSRVAEPTTWREVARLIGRRSVEITELHVNYRTPTEIAALAREVLAAAGHDPDEAPEAVRSSGEAPRHLAANDLPAAAAAEVRRLTSEHGGTVGVLAEPAAVATLEEAVATEAGDEADRVRVLDVRSAKGLEFDDVVVMDPDAIVAASSVGTHQLYVAITRATRRLTLVAPPDSAAPGLDGCERVDAAV